MWCSGCSRQYYRQKADNEVYSILNTVRKVTGLNVRDMNITPKTNSRTRMSSNADAGRWLDCLEKDETGAVVLDKNKAVDLALLHSPAYQSAKENLYLSASNVSDERYRFDVQFFGGDSVFYDVAGRLKGGTQTLSHNPYLRGEKLLASGGELVVGLANSVTWTLGGKSSWEADSILNVGFVQPLLRGAGRLVVLESLTQSERDFLADMRQMVFYQQGFYTQFVTGIGSQKGPDGSTGPSSRGFYGLLSEQIRIQNQRHNIISLEENLNQFVEIFETGQVDAQQIERIRQNLLSSESRFLAQINNYQTSVDNYLCSLGLPPDLKVIIKDPLMDKFQLSSVSLTDLQNDVAAVLADIRSKDKPLPEGFTDKLRNLKERSQTEITLLEKDMDELKKNIPARLEDLKILRQLLDGELARGERIDKSVYDTEIFEERINKLKTKDIPVSLDRLKAAFLLIDTIVNTDEATLRKQIQDKSFNNDILNAMTTLKLNVTSVLDTEKELQKKQEQLEEKQNELQSLQQAFDKNNTERVTANLNAQKIIAELRRRDSYRDWVRRVLSAFQYELVSLSLMQTRIRLESITLSPAVMTPEAAFETASQNRLDWVNQRAELQDARRHIEIAADKLKGDMSFTFDGKLGTLDQDGLNLSSKTGTMMLGLSWDSPLTRHTEMLDYRRALIAYQDTYRNYYTYVDNVKADLREILRAMKINQIEFEIARNSILIAAKRVDYMQLQMEKPSERGTSIDTNTAENLNAALDTLMNSQNTFLETWVAYQTQRMQLELNLGTMMLDSRGHWIEEDKINSATPPNHSASPAQAAPQLAPALPVPKLNKRYTD
ncbi:hypothetical protein FACS189419_08230 [Planctomycetales bacterium]|nr:hypothetical protein FACS189419_08230 [Planctomycetales bacterium]